jgi:hypothetical protein
MENEVLALFIADLSLIVVIFSVIPAYPLLGSSSFLRKGNSHG